MAMPACGRGPAAAALLSCAARAMRGGARAPRRRESTRHRRCGAEIGAVPKSKRLYWATFRRPRRFLENPPARRPKAFPPSPGQNSGQFHDKNDSPGPLFGGLAVSWKIRRPACLAHALFAVALRRSRGAPGKSPSRATPMRGAHPNAWGVLGSHVQVRRAWQRFRPVGRSLTREDTCRAVVQTPMHGGWGEDLL